MTDDEYVALNAKLDAILERLDALEQRPVIVTQPAILPAPDSVQFRQFVGHVEQEIGKKIRMQASLPVGWSVPKRVPEGEQGEHRAR